MKIRILAILLLSPSFANSSEAAFCRSIDELAKGVKDCSQNEYISEASVKCLQRLEAAVSGASKELGKKLIAPKKKDASAQALTFDNSGSNYNMSVAKLDALLAQARASALEVVAYQKVTVLPEDFDEPTITGGDEDKFLDESECYSRADKVNDRVLIRFAEHILSLEDARKVASAHEATSGASEKNIEVNSLTGAEPIKTGVGKGAPGTPVKGVRRGNSSVSGIEKDAAENKKLKP